MINGLGVVGWGVGGIEAEAVMVGQPLSRIVTPEVIGFKVHRRACKRRRAPRTDLTLTVTEILRKHKVVGKFVEFFGEGTASLSLPDRATIANMAPEYGATMGFFPVDAEDHRLLPRHRPRQRRDRSLRAPTFQGPGPVRRAGCPGASQASGDIQLLAGGLGWTWARWNAEPGRSQAPAGPHRTRPPGPSSPVSRPAAEKHHPTALLHTRPSPSKEPADTLAFKATPTPPGAPRFVAEMEAKDPRRAIVQDRPTRAACTEKKLTIGNGDVLIAAITSCTNTSNPSVMLAAGLLAKKAVEGPG